MADFQRLARRFLILLLSILLFPVVVETSAQETTLPRYAVAFAYRGGTRIAVLGAAGSWRFDDLPRAYFGQGDVGLIHTVWSPDGRTAYLAYAAPGDGQYRFIYAYDVVAHEQSPVVFLDKASKSNDYSLISVSPDGRYLWIIRLVDGTSRLVDTKAPPDKRVVARMDECPGAVLAWLEGHVLVQGFYGCAYTNYLFDLKTGKSEFSYLQTDKETDLTFGATVIPLTDGKPWVLVYSPGSGRLSKLSLDTGKPEKWLDTERFIVAKDHKSAAFAHEGHLYVLDLGTLAVTDLDKTDSVRSSFAADDGLVFLTVEPQDAPHTIHRITVKAGQRHDSTIYEGQPFVDASFAPEGQGFLLDFGEEDGYALYNADGKRIWRSQDEPPEIAAQLNFALVNDSGRWTSHWFHSVLRAEPGNQDQPGRSFAVNVDNGKFLLAPEQTPIWVSASPDETWWLYVRLDLSSEVPKDELIAYNINTGKSVTFSDGEALAQRNFHFPLGAYYVWSGSIR
jgi:hypothetical protein